MPASSYYVGTRPIFAHLSGNKDGSWEFRTVTTSDEPSDTGYLVRLNDLTPAFDTRVAECVPQVYPETHRCNLANAFRDEDSGVLDKIINGSIAVGTAGKVTDITYAYKTTFDEPDFNRAVDEALLNTGLDRRRLISLVERYDEELKAAHTELGVAAERMQASRAGASRVALDVRPTVSGLVEYYQGDIDFAQLVDLEVADDVPLPAAAVEATPILPCEARKCIAVADAALATLHRNIELNREQFAAGTRPLSRTYNVRCDMVSYGAYLLQAECPAQVVVTDDRPVQLPINITILSRDFDGLYPGFGVADPYLRVDVDGQTVTFFNTTNEYLTVSAQTVYYNSKVHTTALPIDIPPGISVARNLQDFVSQSIDIESRYRQMTPDKAAGASFQFGFAVRYRLASQPDERTLHNLHTFNVGCVIENRMRPGSCPSETVADISATPETTVQSEKQPGPM
ncbi:MAG: hypothetical protein OEW59_00805 [Gammaproteobacteria bacterium]|nr:hypothetical protein [Gammaproteobacteria bacterium]